MDQKSEVHKITDQSTPELNSDSLRTATSFLFVFATE